MIRRIRPTLVRSAAGAAALLTCAAALAITPEELRKELGKANPPTIIDVRAAEIFTQGHIAGAINIPASLVPQKTLPKLGRVIVYGDGFNNADKKAIEALNTKPGIKAEILEGGYSAWETEQGTTTGKRGLSPEKVQFVTYAQLLETTNNVLLVDLRKQPTPKKKTTNDANGVAADEPAPLTDLSKAFPGKPIATSPHQVAQQAKNKAASPGAQPILVLIDNGDGTAQKTAAELRAQGNKRVVILAGGELTIARQGQKGSQRTGMSLENFKK